jgi:predicted lipoprotein with Yx(FWY)xxD motif
MTLATPPAIAMTLAACGATGSTATSAKANNASFTSKTIAVRKLPGVGRVLVNNAGKALYANNLETAGKVLCNAGCTAFWTPLTIHGDRPTATKGAGKLGVTKRPNGSTQVTANGKPLYTFSEDSPGKATGNGFHDQFAGHHFTWNIVRAGGTLARGSQPGSSAPPSYSLGSTSGNYGY